MAERPTKSAAELGNQSWCRLADAVRQFEQAWQSGSNPELAQFLPPGGDPLRERVLVELIKVDQECRWQAGQPQEIEAYLTQWPELRREPETMIELVEAECLTRACHQAMPTREELGARFPEVAPRIDLGAVAAQAQQEQGSAPFGTAPQVQADTSREQQERTPAEGPVPLPAMAGRRFGRYEIRQQLGRGGMGTVYRAYDTHLEREVALKVPQLDLMADEVVRERFLREARSAAAIRHRNVCPIYDAGQIDATYYISMALIEGRSLAEWMEDRTIDPRQAAELVAKLARALEAVHAAGVLHRDVKPSNVMIDASGEPLLMDFGLARQTESRSRLTDSGSFLGTPAYMSPEQADGKPADARSDVYGLGLMLYQMLTGELPFSGPPARLLHNIVHAPPPKPGRLRPDLDLRLEQICLKAMAKIPGARHQTAGQLADALQEWLRSAGPPARRRRLASVAAAGAAAILLLGVMIYVKTKKGTLVLEVDPRDVNVTIDGNQVQIKSPRDEIRLTVGEHHLEVTKDGFQTQTDSFTIRRGGKTEIVARLESASSRPPGTSESPAHGRDDEASRKRTKPGEHSAGFTDEFEGGPLNDDLWSVGGRAMSFTPSHPGSWTWSFQAARDLGDADGYLEIKAQGPASGGSFGAVVWIRSHYDLNDGQSHVLNFTWKARVAESHGNHYFVQIVEGDNLPSFEESSWVDGWLDREPPGTKNLLWYEVSGKSYPARQYPSGTPKQEWSISVDSLGVAKLYDGPDASGAILGKADLDPKKPWYTRLMLYDATSAGFGNGESSLSVYSFSARVTPEKVTGTGAGGSP